MSGLAALGLGAAGLERLASSTLKIIPALFTRDFFKDPGIGFLGLIRSSGQALGFPLFIVLALVVLGALVLISFRLSVRIYEKKEF